MNYNSTYWLTSLCVFSFSLVSEKQVSFSPVKIINRMNKNKKSLLYLLFTHLLPFLPLILLQMLTILWWSVWRCDVYPLPSLLLLIFVIFCFPCPSNWFSYLPLISHFLLLFSNLSGYRYFFISIESSHSGETWVMIGHFTVNLLPAVRGSLSCLSRSAGNRNDLSFKLSRTTHEERPHSQLWTRDQM